MSKEHKLSHCQDYKLSQREYHITQVYDYIFKPPSQGSHWNPFIITNDFPVENLLIDNVKNKSE